MPSKVLNLSLTFKNFQGRTIVKGEVLEEDIKKQQEPLTLKDLLCILLGNKTAHGKEATMVWSLGRRIWEAKKEFEVNDEDFGFLKKVTEENSNNIFRAIVIGQVLEYFDSLHR